MSNEEFERWMALYSLEAEELKDELAHQKAELAAKAGN
jgi:hypothetical protein